MNDNKEKVVVAVSGGFDPVHVGHLRMFEAAKKLGDELLVIVNDDNFLTRKKGQPFMKLEDRMEIIAGFRCVDHVKPAVDKDDTICESLRAYKPNIFANGGDRTSDNVPEMPVCDELGIEMIWEVGGGKIRSSSDLIRNSSVK